jgi:glycosyltransferase involved in cell wall biosynthesis
MKDIMVSICCITYNHEKYISDAIESFLMQKTSFKYEILIHDDASTDKTTEIIRAYEKDYPSIIKPIYQIENQYSKGVKVGKLNNMRANGKYIALCEGDDFWTDPLKLQKQVSYLEHHPECSLCVHAVHMVDKNSNALKQSIRPSSENKTFTTEEVIQGGGGFFGTNSMIYPAKFEKNKPGFFETAPVGDYPLAIYLALKGKVYYLDEFMSSYRVGSENSWVKNNSSSLDKTIAHFNKIADMLEEINQYSGYIYNEVINKTILINQFKLLLAQEKFNEAKKGEYKRIYDELDILIRLKIFINQYFPIAKKTYSIVKRRIKK